MVWTLYFFCHFTPLICLFYKKNHRERLIGGVWIAAHTALSRFPSPTAYGGCCSQHGTSRPVSRHGLSVWLDMRWARQLGSI